MRIIYVLERKDRQPFELDIAKQKLSGIAVENIAVIGVGFPTAIGATHFLNNMVPDDPNEYTIQELVEGAVPGINAPSTSPDQVN